MVNSTASKRYSKKKDFVNGTFKAYGNYLVKALGGNGVHREIESCVSEIDSSEDPKKCVLLHKYIDLLYTSLALMKEYRGERETPNGIAASTENSVYRKILLEYNHSLEEAANLEMRIKSNMQMHKQEQSLRTIQL